MRQAFALLVLMTACSNATPAPKPAATPAADRASCCPQCSQASRRDPSGTDISVKPCSAYREGIDAACQAFFQGQRTRVGECWDLDPPSQP